MKPARMAVPYHAIWECGLPSVIGDPVFGQRDHLSQFLPTSATEQQCGCLSVLRRRKVSMQCAYATSYSHSIFLVGWCTQ